MEVHNIRRRTEKLETQLASLRTEHDKLVTASKILEDAGKEKKTWTRLALINLARSLKTEDAPITVNKAADAFELAIHRLRPPKEEPETSPAPQEEPNPSIAFLDDLALLFSTPKEQPQPAAEEAKEPKKVTQEELQAELQKAVGALGQLVTASDSAIQKIGRELIQAQKPPQKAEQPPQKAEQPPVPVAAGRSWKNMGGLALLAGLGALVIYKRAQITDFVKGLPVRATFKRIVDAVKSVPLRAIKDRAVALLLTYKREIGGALALAVVGAGITIYRRRNAAAGQNNE